MRIEHCDCMAFSVWQNEWMIPNSRKKFNITHKPTREREKYLKNKITFYGSTHTQKDSKKTKKKKEFRHENGKLYTKWMFWVKERMPMAIDTQWINIKIITMSWSFSVLIYKWCPCANNLVWCIDLSENY